MKQIDYDKYKGYTPGPWKVWDDGCSVVSHAKEFITTMDWRLLEEDRGNLYLIADAPMLLNACRERDDKLTHACSVIDSIIAGETLKYDVHPQLIALHLHLKGESND